jgi:hypothetical protein
MSDETDFLAKLALLKRQRNKRKKAKARRKRSIYRLLDGVIPYPMPNIVPRTPNTI